jgi:deazaflavin-dependent oxidoreductase (nitroreductase family)
MRADAIVDVIMRALSPHNWFHQEDMMPYDRIRSFNKHTLNKVTCFFARLPQGPFAVIRHTGRRSGKPYETPIMVRRKAGSFVIALTYGPKVDWYRNVLAAGRAMLLWHGKEYALGAPEPVPAKMGLQAFSAWQRPILRRLGVRDFVRMKSHRVAVAG